MELVNAVLIRMGVDCANHRHVWASAAVSRVTVTERGHELSPLDIVKFDLRDVSKLLDRYLAYIQIYAHAIGAWIVSPAFASSEPGLNYTLG